MRKSPLSRAAALAVLAPLGFASVAPAQAQPLGPMPGQPGGVPGAPAYAEFLEPIHMAAMKGDMDAIRAELARGANIDEPGKAGVFAGSTPLMLAARDAYAVTLRELLKLGADVHARDGRGVTPLMWAASSRGTTDKIKVLLEAGADVNARNNDGATALHWAASLAPDPAMLEALLDAGADIDATDIRGRTALMGAARAGNIRAVRVLLERGADTAAIDLERQFTALHWAAEGRSSSGEIVQALLDAGIPIDTRAPDGSTALIIAAENGCLSQLQALLDRGPDVAAANAHGGTALAAAAVAESPDAARMLLDAGADPNTRDAMGRTPLFYAVQADDSVTARLLVERGAQVDIVDNDRFRPLFVAKTVPLVDLLLSAGAEPNARCENSRFPGWTPLMFAAVHADSFAVRRLLRAGADPTIRTHSGLTALKLATARQGPSTAAVIEALEEATPN